MRRHFPRWAVICLTALTLAISIPAIALSMEQTASQAPQDPFGRIGAAGHARTAAVLDPASAATVQMLNTRGQGTRVLGAQLAVEARLLPTRIGGKQLYLIPTEKGKLCALLEGGAEACTDPLTDERPAFLVAMDDDGPGGAGPTVFGVALDGVRTISVAAGGSRMVVPVSENTFTFVGDSALSVADVAPSSATFDDGRTVDLR